MAGFAVYRVARDRDHAAYVDADRRQNSVDAESMDQPLMARHPLRDLSWANDFADPIWE